MSAEVNELTGLPSHVNIEMSQSRPGRICVSAFAANRGSNSIPTAFSWLCATSNVSARSWFPEVVLNLNDSRPTPGHVQIALLFRDGALGPPVQRFARSFATTARWLNVHRAKNGR